VLIQSLVQRLVPLGDLERRRFVSGNPAQFQGDERDLVFLSMVDVPEQHPLPMQERLTFKQRYNVAASRARDQLWLVHSLDPRRDLQPGDLRRRLIEHVREPANARRARAQQGSARAQSPFEEEVLERLRAAGFPAQAQVDVGGHAIDIVVSDGRQQVAIECDGDRLQPPARIGADMARQAVLERVGWRFVRVRATRFFRDRDATMDAVFAELARLGITPNSEDESTGVTEMSELGEPAGDNLRNKIVRRAWQLMREQEWVEAPEKTETEVDAETATSSRPKLVPPLPEGDADADGEATDPDARTTGSITIPTPTEEVAAAEIAELVLEDTTEPNFVILEQWEDRRGEKS
jgi:very-short-patch-repair endonuclease